MLAKTGFTLIELLVVISIIALLMGILVPVVSRARELCNETTCRNNLRQYAISSRMYLDDNNNRFFTPHRLLHKDYDSPDKQPEYCQWHNATLTFNGQLWPYLKDKKNHMCPTFRKLGQIFGSGHFMHNASIEVVPQYSYSMNAYLGDDPYGVVRSDLQVKGAANIFFFTEENMWPIPNLSTAELNNTHMLVRYPAYQKKNFSDCFGTFHSTAFGRSDKGSANVAFVDGHVDTIKAAQQQDNGAFLLAWPKELTKAMLE